MTDVVFVPCKDYSSGCVEKALTDVLEPLGGLSFIKKGMKVAIKANLVSFMKPEAAATTHPALLCRLTSMIVDRGASVIVGDSPGGLYNKAFVSRVYATTQMHDVEKAGGRLNWDFSQTEEHYDEAVICKDFQFTAYLKDCDCIIDFCKLKTHGMMAYSGAVKNMFGVIPGTIKPEYHFRYPNTVDFANMIVDLCQFVKPTLSIIDGVIGMEGNGPTMGRPKHIGVIGASFNPHKLDLAAAYLIGLKKENVPTLMAAYKRGLIPSSVNELDIVGHLDSHVVSDFERIDNYNSIQFNNELPGIFGNAFSKVASRALCSYPKVKVSDCVGCRKCYEICPAKAITMIKDRPHIDRRTCIHCFCCQEFCPKGALKVKRPTVAKVLNK